MIPDHFDDRLFGEPVHRGDEFVAPLLDDLERLEPVEVAYHDLPGSPCGPHSDIDHPVHSGMQRRIAVGHKQS